MLISNTPNAKRQTPNATGPSSLVVAGLSVVLASIISAWIWNGGMITIFEILVWRPLAFSTILMGASFWWSRRNKTSLAQSLNELLAFVPYALIFAILISFIPVWKLDYASLPMGLGDIGLYFVSLGIAPRLAGPDILLRGFAWGIAIFAAINTYKTRKDIGTSLLDFLLVWISSSIALLLPWFVFWIIGAINDAGLANGQEVIRIFSQTALNSYWSNLQIVRWFLGFGEQLSHSMALLLSSFFFILTALYSVVAFKDKLFLIIKKINWENPALMSLALATGLIAGWGRGPWAWIDISVWLVLIAVLACSVILFQAWSENSYAVFGYCLAGGLLGSFILGWPVLVAFLAFMCVVFISSTQTIGDSTTLYVVRGTRYVFTRALIFITLAGMGLAFARRGDVMTRQMLFTTVAMLLLCLPAFLPKQIDWLKQSIIWFVAGVIATLLIQSLVPVAITVLAVAIWHGLQKFKPNLMSYLVQSIYICAVIVLVLGILLPRLLNPRLFGY
ncbi:MAG: hypothetical protein WCW31_06100 [Patescibacteria group bacterium]